MNYPEIARRAGVEGRVTVEFVVNEQGNVQDVAVKPGYGIGAGCDEEAIRVVSLAKFMPGKQRGKPVKVRMSALPEGAAGEPALYHLDEDPEEKYDRADMYPDLAARLQAAMEAFDAEARR